MSRIKTEFLSIGEIEVPEFVTRGKTYSTDENTFTRSIQKGGVQQPLVIYKEWDKCFLIDGLRRLEVCRALGIAKVRCVVADIPRNMKPEKYARRLRFILDQHRQDLLPSQNAELLQRLKTDLKLNNPQLAGYLGVDADTITNRLAVLQYVPDVVRSLDSGALTMQSARVFVGMTPKGQEVVLRRHWAELTGKGRAGSHKKIRAQYPPAQFPQFYKNPESVERKLARKKAKRTAKKPSYTTDEKQKLLSSMEILEAELLDLKHEGQQIKDECIACSPIVAAILRNKKLRERIPENMLPELERFAEVY